MSIEGPTAPILRNVLVRAPRLLEEDDLDLGFVRRNKATISQFWDRLRAAGSSQAIAAAAQDQLSLAGKNVDTLLGGAPYDSLQPAYLVSLRALLTAEGLSRAAELVTQGLLGQLFSAANLQHTTSLTADLWDNVTARLITRQQTADIPRIFDALKLIHLANVARTQKFSEAPSAQPFFTELIIPREMIEFVNKATKDKKEKDSRQRKADEDRQSNLTREIFKNAILTRAAREYVASAIEMGEIGPAVALPPLNLPNAAGATDGAKPSFDTSNFKLALSARAIAAIEPSVARFLADQFGVANLDQADAIKLSTRLSKEVVRLTSQIFRFVSVNLTLEASWQLDFLATELNSGRLHNLEKAIELATNRFPLGAVATLRTGTLPIQPGKVRPAGIADLKVVNQQLHKYQLGEVAYIENVLAGEERERIHNRLERTEQQLIIETEESSSTERDLQTTERFELSQELDSMQKENRTTDAGVNVTASYGAVSIAAHANKQDSSSAENAIKSARSYTKESVDRAIERIQKRNRHQQTITVTNEITETNKHRFVAAKSSIVGIYRYVEKVYWCQTLNYGARLMLEFMVPEPAAYFLFAQLAQPKAPNGLSPPDELTISAGDIDDTNYLALAAKYKAAVTDPPKSLQFANVAYFTKKTQEATTDQKHTIENGYEVVGLYAVPFFLFQDGTPRTPSLVMIFGSERWDSDSHWPYHANIVPPIRGDFSINVIPYYVVDGSWVVGITLILRRTREAYEKWQLETFNALADAYRLAKDEYDKKVDSLQAQRQNVQLRSDADYRNVERLELRRAALELLTDQHFDSFGAIKPINNIPTIDNASAFAEGPIVQFFEQAFEWNEMTYVFYPYFWGRKSEWLQRMSLSDADPIFSKFLKAGYARVVVPVRKNYESDVSYFLETGIIWGKDHPGAAPDSDDPDYLSIIKEIREMDAALEQGNLDGVPEGAPWQIAVPTPLVCLDSESVKLPSWEITPAGKVPYVPSEATCDGIPYNAGQWPDLQAIGAGLRALGYTIPEIADLSNFFRSTLGRRTVQAFQRIANRLGVAAAIGRKLKIDGVIGPCTLRALSVMTEKLSRKEWPGPNIN